MQVKYTKIGRSLFMKSQPESWHIQYSHCCFLCHKFSDPSVLFFWLIYSSAFSITMAKANILWKEDHLPSSRLPPGRRRKEHRFIVLTTLATWAYYSQARSARLQCTLAKPAWGTDHLPHQQHLLVVPCLTQSSSQQRVLQRKAKTGQVPHAVF